MPLDPRFSIFRFLPSTSRFPIRVVPRFSRDSCRIRFPPANRLPFRFPTKPVSRFAATQPDQTVPSPNSQNKRRSRRSDERSLRWIRVGSASAQCFPAFVLPRGIIILRVFPKQFIDQRTNIYIADHSFDLREGMVLPWKPQNEFPQTALEPK